MLGNAKNFLRPFDLFGYNNFLFYKSKKKLKTSFFGCISLTFFLIIISKLITNINVMFQDDRETNNIVYYKLEDQDKASIKKNKLPMIFQIEVKDLIEKRKADFSSIFGKEIFIRYYKNHNKSDGFLRKYNMSDIVLPLKDLEINSNVLQEFDYELFKKENFRLTDYYECNSLFYVNLTAIGIENNFTGTLSFIFQKYDMEANNINQIYMQYNFITIDTIIENIKRKNNFFREELRSNFLTAKVKNGININLKKILIKSYASKFMFSKSFDEYEIIRYEISNSNNVNNFFEINISLYDKMEIYERNYFNLVSLLSESGGLLSTFKSLIFIIHIFYEYYFIRNLKNLIFLDDKKLYKTIPKNFRKINNSIFFKKDRTSFFKNLFDNKMMKYKEVLFDKFSINNKESTPQKKRLYFDENKNYNYNKITDMTYIKPKLDVNLSLLNEERICETDQPLIPKRNTFKFESIKKIICAELYNKKDLIKLSECIKELLDVRRLLLLQIRYNEFFNLILETFHTRNSKSKKSVETFKSIESLMDDSINR